MARGCSEQDGVEKVCSSDFQPVEIFSSSIHVAVIVSKAAGEAPDFSQSDLRDLYEGQPVGGRQGSS